MVALWPTLKNFSWLKEQASKDVIAEDQIIVIIMIEEVVAADQTAGVMPRNAIIVVKKVTLLASAEKPNEKEMRRHPAKLRKAVVLSVMRKAIRRLTVQTDEKLAEVVAMITIGEALNHLLEVRLLAGSPDLPVQEVLDVKSR